MPRPVRYGFSVIPKNSDDGLRSVRLYFFIVAGHGCDRRGTTAAAFFFSARLDKYAERFGYRYI